MSTDSIHAEDEKEEEKSQRTTCAGKKSANPVPKGNLPAQNKLDHSTNMERLKGKSLTVAKRTKNGNDIHRGRKKFSVSPRGKKSKTETKSGKQQSLCVDPLNLTALIGKCGSDSPQDSSPIVERAQDFEPREILSTNLSDPLQLNISTDEGSSKNAHKKRKKRKRRHTYHGEDDSLNEHTENEKDITCLSKIKRQKSAERCDLNSDEVFADHPNTSIQNDKEQKILDHRVTPEKRKVVEVHNHTIQQQDIEVFNNDKQDQEDSIASEQLHQQNTTQKKTHFEESQQVIPKSVRFREKDNKFKYGNYNRYYGYRNPNMSEDSRITLIQREWIIGKDCLDIGCNVGHVALWIARHFHPKIMVGVDIDGSLIRAAQNNVRHYLPTRINDAPCESEFPISFALCHGPLAAPVCLTKGKEAYGFPYNVTFHEENYVPLSEQETRKTVPKYDTILCLSVTKWVHLNWGDVGLQRMFKKIFINLKPGGRLVLEPQPFKSYKKKKNLTPEIRKNYDKIKLHPDKFIPYLLSKEVGFATSEVLDNPHQKQKGFRRPMYVLTKSKVVSAYADST